jgi:uncharacterized protein YegL
MTHAVQWRVLVDKTSVRRPSAPAERVELHLVTELVGVGAPVERTRAALSVVLLLDASGSMKGEPIRQVCRSAELLSELLRTEDRLGVVTFSDRAAEVAPLSPMTPDAKRVIKRRIEAIKADGRTNFEAALLEGKAQFGARAENERRVMVLLSDGKPNCGASTTPELEKLVATLRPDACLATLGFGPLHDADILLNLARTGGGQYGFIPDPNEATVEFSRTIGAQVDVVADAIEISFLPEEGVEIVDVYDHKLRFTKAGVVTDIPDLREGCAHVVVTKVAFEPSRERGLQDLMAVRVTHRASGEMKTFRSEAKASVAVADQEAIDAEAHTFVELALAERLRREARRAADQSNFEVAVAVLSKAITRLEAIPGYKTMDGSALSEAVEQLIDERTVYGRHPSTEAYGAFKASSLGVDLAQGARHSDSVGPRSEASQAFMNQALGNPTELWLVIDCKDGRSERVSLVGNEFTVGRIQGNDICLEGGNVSKRHARFSFRDGRLFVTDLQSTNGTYVNRARINTSRPVNPGDRVYIGNYVIRIEPPYSPGEPNTPGTVVPFSRSARADR